MARKRTATKPLYEGPMHGPKRRASNRCAWCLELGHDLRNCTRAKAKAEGRERNAKHGTSNADYRANRRRKLCDNCGAKSPRMALCPRCSAKRKLSPSRDGQNPKVIAQRKRWRANAKQRGSRWT